MNSLIKSAFLTFPPFLLAFAMISSYAESSRVSLWLGVFLTINGSFFFVNATNFFNKLILTTSLGHQLIRKYSLSLSGCLDISNKLISAIQAMLSVIFGILVCRYSCSRNFLTTSHIFSESYAWFGSAYFIYDIFSMYKVYCAKLYDKFNMKPLNMEKTDDFYSMIPTINSKELSFFTPLQVGDEKVPSFWEYIKINKLMVFHHMFIGSYGLCVISSWRGGLGDCVFSFMFLMEASTPFVNFRAILITMNLKKSKIYIVNGLLMILFFTIFRIVMLPTLLYYYSRIVNLSFIEAIMKLPTACLISIAALFLPQFYWYYLMIRVAMKMFQVQSPNKDINENNRVMMKKAD